MDTERVNILTSRIDKLTTKVMVAAYGSHDLDAESLAKLIEALRELNPLLTNETCLDRYLVADLHSCFSRLLLEASYESDVSKRKALEEAAWRLDDQLSDLFRWRKKQ
jgi:hypothetical protein